MLSGSWGIGLERCCIPVYVFRSYMVCHDDFTRVDYGGRLKTQENFLSPSPSYFKRSRRVGIQAAILKALAKVPDTMDVCFSDPAFNDERNTLIVLTALLRNLHQKDSEANRNTKRMEHVRSPVVSRSG